MSSGWIYYWMILNIRKTRMEITRNETERGNSWAERKLGPVLCGSWFGTFWFHFTVNKLDVRMGYLTKVGRHSQHTVGLLLCKKNWLIWLLGEKCNCNRMNSYWKEKYTTPLLPMAKKCGNLGTLIQGVQPGTVRGGALWKYHRKEGWKYTCCPVAWSFWKKKFVCLCWSLTFMKAMLFWQYLFGW